MLSKRKTQSAQVLDPAQQFAMLCCMRPLRLSVRIAALSAEITEVYEELKEKREFFRQYNHLIHGDMKSSARNEVKQLQRKFNELRAEKRHLESVDRAMADPGEYIRDYQEVRALPSVTMASVRGAEALFWVRASIQYQGSRYDLGDWELVLSFETEQIFARQKRTGLLESAAGVHHRYSWDGFCFGQNVEFLQGLVMAGQYGDALKTAVYYINSVNDEHQRLIPKTYQEMR
ncbi:hypothetical protein CL689_01400 [Candidatus Saccharibacteria bacterium]|nr:hypothetical protein [Candidatus Saccharibacteria bacterium]MBQ68706.1 hypothetical protein [Candidatus Saccharibacteria bacterium]|tara:strand:- start:1193 stop:1888 length:696 start_codon:yes stop_codon:yes gene_type:complete